MVAIHGDKGLLPRDPTKNTATIAAQAMLDYLGEPDRGIAFELHKKCLLPVDLVVVLPQQWLVSWQ